MSRSGAAPLCWSVAHVGPIGATVDDAALLYSAMAGRDPADPNTQRRPPVSFERYDGNLYGIRWESTETGSMTPMSRLSLLASG